MGSTARWAATRKQNRPPNWANHVSPLGTGGSGSFEFIVDSIHRNAVDFSLHLDAQSYLETLNIDSIWVDHCSATASAAVTNYMGRFKGTRAYKMFIVADSNNRSAFLRLGDRCVQGVSGQPNFKVVPDEHYGYFEWRSCGSFEEKELDPLSVRPDTIIAETGSETFVTKPFNVFRIRERTHVSCLPVARLTGDRLVIRDIWLEYDDEPILWWREETLTHRPINIRTRIAALINRLAWAGGADFEPFCVGYRSHPNIESTKVAAAFLH